MRQLALVTRYNNLVKQELSDEEIEQKLNNELEEAKTLRKNSVTNVTSKAGAAAEFVPESVTVASLIDLSDDAELNFLKMFNPFAQALASQVTKIPIIGTEGEAIVKTESTPTSKFREAKEGLQDANSASVEIKANTIYSNIVLSADLLAYSIIELEALFLARLKRAILKTVAIAIVNSDDTKNGNVKAVQKKLDELGITHTCFYEVAPDPTLQCAMAGVNQMKLFEPDVIIAFGGGSPMDAAKIMWIMYEYPEARFEDMAMDFMDIRKRIYEFPSMGKKCYFVAIPTSAGTGSEVTPFAIITDADTGVKWPIADYELMPNMAIVDVDNMMEQPKSLTSASGIDVFTHATEAYVSVMASSYTDGLALKAMKLVMDYLPAAYEKGAADPVARERMAEASCLAGMAFANAFLGINHSLAHKLGAFHHIPHGWANAIILTRIMRYNADPVPTKMGTFPQYEYPHAKERYIECAKFCGITGKDDDEIFENYLKKIEELKEKIGVKKTIRDYGVDEKYFLDTLDEMSEQAFNDQCTGANPRYPLVSEIKEIYLDAYYGRD